MLAPRLPSEAPADLSPPLGTQSKPRRPLVPAAPGAEHRAPSCSRGKVLLLGSHYKLMNTNDLLPPSGTTITKMLPNAGSWGVFFFLFLFAFFFQIFMKRFSIYPDTSSPPWVSAGRAQTTNSRRYFPQSSIWLRWQVQRVVCWELAEEEGGGATGWQPPVLAL